MLHRSVGLLASLCCAWLALASAGAQPADDPRSHANKGAVGVISGGVDGTYIRIAADLAAVLGGNEGVRILANLMNVKPDDVRSGMPVKLVWERLSEEFNYPAFEPA